MFKKMLNGLRVGLASLPLALAISACAVPATMGSEPISQQLQLIEEDAATAVTETLQEEAPEEATAQVTEASPEEQAPLAVTKEVQEEAEDALDEAAFYDQKDDVALYLVTYHHLPSNYITKKQAQKLGWEGGKLEEYAPGCSIGGDYFGNYEGLLPDDVEYHECDIDATGRKRGVKRIIYSEDWKIYYTDDHYDSFEQLY